MNKNGSRWIEPWKRLAIYLRDDFHCQYCGKDLKYGTNAAITLDHLIPREYGGTHDYTNLVTACVSCNSARKSIDWQQYATGGAIERITVQVTLDLPETLAKEIMRGKLRGNAVEAYRAYTATGAI